MKKLLGFLQLKFLPASTDLGLLILRVWLGLTMAINHGWGKVTGFGTMSGQFPNYLGLGSTVNLVIAIVGELICALLLVAGLGTRFAALVLGVVMSVAFFVAHGGQLSGPGSGEMAFLYLAGCVTLLVAGPGKFSVDGKSGA